MSLLISISAVDLDCDSLEELTRRLCQDLRTEAGIEASLATKDGDSGTRGDLVTTGQIVIAAIGAGGVLVELVGVLKAYAARKPSLQIKIEKPDGTAIEISADDLRRNDMEKLLQTIKKTVECTE